MRLLVLMVECSVVGRDLVTKEMQWSSFQQIRAVLTAKLTQIFDVIQIFLCCILRSRRRRLWCCPISTCPCPVGNCWRVLEVVLSTGRLLPSSIASKPNIYSGRQGLLKQGFASLIDEEAGDPVSAWGQSRAKRFFDLICVLLAAPLILPICLCIGIVVRLTSRGPAIFKQDRSGLKGARFTIFKFRTMEHNVAHKAESTLNNQRFTPIGPFLRRWKLDELPQLLNVLLGEMSLVGPRPKMPEHQLGVLGCRPGLTGAATLVFANEEAVLTNVPQDGLSDYFRTTVLPAKLRLDREYMAEATFASDLELIIRTLFRRWDRDRIFDLLRIEHPRTASSREEAVADGALDFAMDEAATGD